MRDLTLAIQKGGDNGKNFFPLDIDKEGSNNVHVHFSYRGGNDSETTIEVGHSSEVNIDEGVALDEREGDSLGIPEDPNGEILGDHGLGNLEIGHF